MKAWVFIIAIAASLGGCDQQPTEKEPTTPSPIVSFDKTRLWILTQASPVSDGRKCSSYFKSPDDLRSTPLADECKAWSLHFADYLRLNGLPTLEPAHVRHPPYWIWFDAMNAKVSECMQSVNDRKLPPRDGEARRQKNYDLDACDPYRHETRNNKMSLRDLGIVRQ